MDKKELIEYMGGKLSNDTLGRLTREGKIPVVKFPNIRRYFFEKEAIDRWLDNLQQGTAGQGLRLAKWGKQVMTYRDYVIKNGSIETAQSAKVKDFPVSGLWDDLQIFVNTCDVSDAIAAELEELHDNYHLQWQGVGKWLMCKLKTALQRLQMNYWKR
jgi:hypothetical protein